MIHAVICANRNGKFGLAEHTPGFPAAYFPHIESVCKGAVVGFLPGESQPGIRYAPVQDRFLLSVFFRGLKGNREEHRGQWGIVNFLLDAPDADRFFLLPFDAAEANVRETAWELLDAARSSELPADIGARLLAERPGRCSDADCAIPLAVLMTGALYGCERPRRNQLFIQCAREGTAELRSLMAALPPALRKRTSFHTNAVFPQESFDLGLVCCAAPVLSRLVDSGFDGCQSASKFYVFPSAAAGSSRIDSRLAGTMQRLLKLRETLPCAEVVFRAVQSWDAFLALADAAREQKPLRAALRIIPEADLMAAVGDGSDLTAAERKLLYRAASGCTELRQQLRSSGLKPRKEPQASPTPTLSRPMLMLGAALLGILVLLSIQCALLCGADRQLLPVLVRMIPTLGALALAFLMGGWFRELREERKK